MRLSDYNINHSISLLDAWVRYIYIYMYIAELRHYYYENRPTLIAVLASFAISPPAIYCIVLKPHNSETK